MYVSLFILPFVIMGIVLLAIGVSEKENMAHPRKLTYTCTRRVNSTTCPLDLNSCLNGVLTTRGEYIQYDPELVCCCDIVFYYPRRCDSELKDFTLDMSLIIYGSVNIGYGVILIVLNIIIYLYSGRQIVVWERSFHGIAGILCIGVFYLFNLSWTIFTGVLLFQICGLCKITNGTVYTAAFISFTMGIIYFTIFLMVSIMTICYYCGCDDCYFLK